jgi:phosphoglycolate phosphatase-like HAD superfamily hydrolase
MNKYVIFDFDDTLVSNQLLDFESFRRTCDYFEIKSLSKHEIDKQRSKGLLAREIIINIIDKSKESLSVDDFLNYRKNFLTSQESNSFLELREYTKNLLSSLEKNGIKFYICSVRSNKKLLTNFLNENNILKYFSKVLIPSDLKIKLDSNNFSNRVLIKNSLIKNILKRIPLDNLVFVGDSKEDLISANNFSVKFILFKKSYFNNQFGHDVMKVSDMKILKNRLMELLL